MLQKLVSMETKPLTMKRTRRSRGIVDTFSQPDLSDGNFADLLIAQSSTSFQQFSFSPSLRPSSTQSWH
jgi:hypothetical protein